MSDVLQLTALIMLLTPWISAVIVGLMARRIGPKGSEAVSMVLGMLSWLMSLLLWYQVVSLQSPSGDIMLYRWCSSGSWQVDIGIWIDPLSVCMAFMVTSVAWVIQLYSIGYMHRDPGYARYFALINFFTGSMLVFVTASSMLQMFFAWEAMAVASYGLVAFWYERTECADGAFKAVMANQLGDYALLMGIMLWGLWGGSWSVASFVDASGLPDLSVGGWHSVASLMLLGVMSKSAELPFHIWVPSAMGAPTPVSALIHASTLVVSGIFWILRFAPIFGAVAYVNELMMVVGALGAVWMAVLACDQHELKAIMAYSTLSQLGMMLCLCGVKAYDLVWFLMLTHCFSKSLMFLVVGRVIYVCDGEDSIGNLGGLGGVMPWTFAFAVLGSASLLGMPVVSSFSAKHAMMEILWHDGSVGKWAAGALCGAHALHAMYGVKWLRAVFLGAARDTITPESWGVMHSAMLFLLLPSVFLGLGIFPSMLVPIDWLGLDHLSQSWHHPGFYSLCVGLFFGWHLKSFASVPLLVHVWARLLRVSYMLFCWDRWVVSGVLWLGRRLAWMDEQWMYRYPTRACARHVAQVSVYLKSLGEDRRSPSLGLLVGWGGIMVLVSLILGVVYDF